MKRPKKERPFHVDVRMPGGNASRFRYEEDEIPRLIFSADPRGGFPLWFYFRITWSDDRPPSPDAKVELVLDYYETLLGADSPRECMPVYMAKGQFWVRMSAAKIERCSDGRMRATWTANRNTEQFEMALCYPYGNTELRQMISKLRGDWKTDGIGLTPGGREIRRVSNSYDHTGKLKNGLYMIARERGCDMPASWVLDGVMQRFASVKNNPFVIWSVPLMDEDGARTGAAVSVPDMMESWCGGPSSGRHEIQVLKQDVMRWKSRCNGTLLLSFRAADLSETDGIYCEVPDQGKESTAYEQAVKWAHVIEHKLGKAFAADSFVRPVSGGRMHDWMASSEMDIPSLTICVPWCSARDTVLSPKKYREAGKLLADALLEKAH